MRSRYWWRSPLEWLGDDIQSGGLGDNQFPVCRGDGQGLIVADVSFAAPYRSAMLFFDETIMPEEAKHRRVANDLLMNYMVDTDPVAIPDFFLNKDQGNVRNLVPLSISPPTPCRAVMAPTSQWRPGRGSVPYRSEAEIGNGIDACDCILDANPAKSGDQAFSWIGSSRAEFQILMPGGFALHAGTHVLL